MFLLLFVGTTVFAQHSAGAADRMDRLGAIAKQYYQKITSDKQSPKPPAKTSAISDRVFNGQATGDGFGYSVSTAGDVNGDGYADIIVGAPHYSGNTGRAYIYYGGPGMDNIPDVILTGETANDEFGISVSTAGDVNGDGYADVIVGAHGYGSGAGRAYIYYGGSSMDNTADVTLNGAAGSNFGISVSTAGDVNGDGYADVIVGSNFYNSYTGRAYIYFGGSSMDNTADVTMTGEATNNNFGYSVSTAGDVNGDGYADVIVGAFGYSGSTGRAYIYYGGSSMDNTADLTMTGEAPSNNFGCSVSTAGDVNGDGYADVVVGANGYNSYTGRAYVYYGGTSMNNLSDVTMTGEGTGVSFGYSVATAGDVNGDGYADVIVGTHGYSSNTGRANIYYGGSSMDNIADITMTGENSGDDFGYSVCAAGDVNGDGYDDVIAGAYQYNSSTGRVYLYKNSLTGADMPDEVFTGGATNDELGVTVSTAGDVNGDGYPDVIIGAFNFNSSTGRAYIYYGGPSMNNNADVTLAGEGVGDYFGISVSTAGDVNGDGYPDVIVGAFGYSGGTGRAYIYYGGPTMNNVADVMMTGEATGNNFGVSVSTAGDVNGDGYADVIVGAYGYSGNTGRAYIYYGGASMNNNADVTLTGEGAGNYFGILVSTAGDVNGDGYADVIVGASGYNVHMGRAYVYYGGLSMDNTADVILTGEAPNDNFGCSVSTAGDVNGDSYADVIVGAYGYNGSTGRAYIYYGGASMNNNADVTLTGEGAGNYFGFSVSTAGDVNADGYADVIVGASGYNVHTGRAYVYYGGLSMDNTADVILTGEAPNDNFGCSVSTTGDVNGDGYADVIVGAYGYSSYKGRAYLYRSSSPPIIPHIMSVKDVPYDQGGKVSINWIRSGYDVKGISGISSYTIERSASPGLSGYFWEQVASITPHNNPKYSYTAAMPYDSMSGTNGAHFFRVTAQTTDANEYWRSNIVSGHSVDNIPPIAPLGGAINPLSGGPIQLSWKKDLQDPDVSHYNIYRSLTPGFTLSSATLLATRTDTTYTDSSALAGQSFHYRLTTVDVHGNQSIPTQEFSVTALALEVTSFTASAQRLNAMLSWTLVTPIEQSRVEIERQTANSTANLDWENVGFVPVSTSPQVKYNFVDHPAVSGVYAYRLKIIHRDGSSAFSTNVEVEVGLAPKEFTLAQNYPNPFNPTTTIEFTLEQSGRAVMKVYNILGQEVAMIFDKEVEAGQIYQAQFNASRFTSGVYMSVLESGGKRLYRKMLLVK